MNLIKERHAHRHRGLIGLEATIIIIAIVLVAAVLAFVGLNMGFSTAQKAKTAIGSTLTSTSSLAVEGKVIGASYIPSSGPPYSLNVTSVPIKIARGGDSVNLDPKVTAVKYLSNQITYDDIYEGTLQATGSFNSLEDATGNAQAVEGYITVDPFTDAGWPLETKSFIYWTVSSNSNEILEVGEHANLVIVFAAGDRPEYLDKIRIELILEGGSTMTVERVIPVIQNQVVDLG